MAVKMNYDRSYDVFISYRRDGGETMALLLRDRLVMKNYSVFLDIESLNSGSFNTKLLQVIENCKDFVAVLSEGSLDRCVNDGDWVRAEIAHAFRNNKNVVPMMLRGFEWPDNLPQDIAGLPMKNGVNANSNEYFDAAIDRLAEKFLLSKPKTLFDKIGSFAKNAADITANKMQINEKMEISKLNQKIFDGNKKISAIKMQISEYYYQKFRNGEELDPEADELCGQISAEFEKIDETNREIQKIKAAIAPKPAVVSDGETSVCINCGTTLTGKSKFCPDCGTPVPAEIPKPSAPEFIICVACGNQLSPGKKFCAECGAAVE